MKSFKQILKESSSPSIGSDKEFNYVVKINGLDSNDFYKQSFGRQISDLRKVEAFKSSAKSYHVGAKGKATLAAVKEFLSQHKPTEVFAKWKKDSSYYKDDSVEVFYK